MHLCVFVCAIHQTTNVYAGVCARACQRVYACVDRPLTIPYFRRASQEALRLCTLSRSRMPRKPKTSALGWRLTAGGLESTIPSLSGHTLQPQEYTWEDPHRKFDISCFCVFLSLFYLY